ncbi:hypothetical protein ES703_109040 [subsurface metagenome]
MDLKFTYSNFIYLDTNIISELVKGKIYCPSFYDFLIKNDLCIAISDAHFAELYDFKYSHEELARFLLLMPSAMIKTRDEIIEEETKSHPNRRTKSLLVIPINQLILEEDGFDKLMGFFSSNKLRDARKGQKLSAKKMLGVHKKLKPNFPPSKSGKYTKNQSSEFADYITMQWLGMTHRQFLKQFNNNIKGLNLEIFLPLRTYAYVIFYKYYLQNREPSKLSDFGDLFHVSYIPYCKLAIIERDLCNVLNQIKRNSNILNNVKIENIDFFKTCKY